jgi:hypothetical protein
MTSESVSEASTPYLRQGDHALGSRVLPRGSDELWIVLYHVLSKAESNISILNLDTIPPRIALESGLSIHSMR